LKAGASLGGDGETALKGFCRDRLAHIKCPRWIEIIDELPKTTTGKIQRFRLRDRAAP
jgi:acyl-coenzyme A synthetase/AMP-(fatty) acid ligase